jgi:hypothetical protein
MTTRSLVLAGLSALLLTLPAAASVAPGLSGSAPVRTDGVRYAKSIVRCMTDDGYGRYRPCDSGYRAANPNWRGGDRCMTDDGYGRYRPCSAGYKKEHSK